MSRGAKKFCPIRYVRFCTEASSGMCLASPILSEKKPARRDVPLGGFNFKQREVIMTEQTRFFQLDINETDHGATLEQDGSTIEIGADQINGVITALQRVSAKHRSDVARRFIDQIKGELAGKKASIHPVGGNGKGPKVAA